MHHLRSNLLLLLIMLSACVVDVRGAEEPEPVMTVPDPKWLSVNDWTYQLQDVNLQKLAASAFDLAVIDYSRDGSDAKRWTAAEIAALKETKLVLAYMSIGEAEDYRWYWRRAWKNDRPQWLGPVNPDWSGNYKVRYWDSEWQAIVISYLDKIIDAGFDGVYLDIIDAYEFWQPRRPTAEREMVDFVKKIAHHARVVRSQPNFGVFPQNGAELAVHPDFVATATGIGREDLWYDGDSHNDPDDVRDGIRYLDKFKSAGKLVLVIDYVRKPANIKNFYETARARGYVPYASVRDLDQLVINRGHEPD